MNDEEEVTDSDSDGGIWSRARSPKPKKANRSRSRKSKKKRSDSLDRSAAKRIATAGTESVCSTSAATGPLVATLERPHPILLSLYGSQKAISRTQSTPSRGAVAARAYKN